MNKNTFLFLLFVAALLGSTWGAVVNRQKIDLEQQLMDVRAELQKLSQQPGQEPQRGPDQSAGIQEIPAQQEEPFNSGQASEVPDQGNSAGALQKSAGEGGVGHEGTALPGNIPIAGLPVEGLQQRLDEVNAQLLGLEKIIDEKNAALQDIAAEKERQRINLDVLLAKIVDLQHALQTIQEDNRELVKQLATRNELVDLRENMPPDKK
ncbi:MAG TPA: hypothetical protein DDY20_03015 [Desulfobulbaceae bacterium]|nr:hypothetical protein [Desulfobulbaceae bacterium]